LTLGLISLPEVFKSIVPVFFDFISITSNPAIAKDAKLVPCAESGIITFFLFSPIVSKYFFAISSPHNSPCAPADGCKVMAPAQLFFLTSHQVHIKPLMLLEYQKHSDRDVYC